MMMRLFVLTSLLSLVVWRISALPPGGSSEVVSMQRRQAATAQAARVYAGGGWLEIIAVRANGQLLLPHTNVPELWSFSPETKTATRLLTFSGALGLTGITELSPDVFAVMAGNFSTRSMSVRAGSWAVWKVDLTAATPKATLVKRVPESGFFLGTTTLSNDTILIADAGKGALYKMNVDTGDYGVVLADKSMDRNGQLAGIHGLHYIDGYAYYTNTFGGGFWKLKVDSSTGKASGSPTQITAVRNPEDFAMAPGGVFYVGRMTGGVNKVTADGKTTPFVNVQSPTGVVFGRGEKDKTILYISTAGGAVFSANAR